MTTLKTRKPTGLVPWPLILVEGGEKSGKSWAAATLSASQRVGRTFWLDLGEGAGDEYGAIPGVRYEIVEHDGSWQEIIGAVEAVRNLAREALAAGQPPIVLVIDSMTAVWDMLKDWASNRARSTDSNRKKLKADPNAEITVSTNFWNDANARHRRLMTMLMTFPGIVVVTARGKEVAEMGPGGAPVAGKKSYRVEGHKDLGFDATVWVRLSRDDHPLIAGCRSVHAGIQPGSDKPRTVPGLELERLIFEILRCNPGEAFTRNLAPLLAGNAGPDGEPAGQPTDEPTQERPRPPAETDEDRRQRAVGLRDWALKPERTGEELRAAHKKLVDEHPATAKLLVVNEHGDDELLSVLMQRRIHDAADAAAAAAKPAETAPPPAMVTDEQHRHMHALWREIGFSGDNNRDNRLLVINRVLGRAEGNLLTTSKDLTAVEADQVIEAQKQRRAAMADQPVGANA